MRAPTPRLGIQQYNTPCTRRDPCLRADENKKSNTIGFEEDMKFIVQELNSVNKKILTSATQKVKIPAFVALKNPKRLNYLSTKTTNLKIKVLEWPGLWNGEMAE